MNKYQKLQAKPIPTTVELWYGNGELRLESDGAVAGVEITFNGEPTFDWNLPDSWTAAEGNGKLILYTMDTESLPEILGYYTGHFEVLSVLVANWNANEVPASIMILDNTKLIS